MYSVAMTKDTNGFATASLVMGIVGLLFGWCLLVPNVLAVVFGHVALSQIRRTGDLGYGRALAGLILGYAFLGLVVIGLTTAIIQNS